MEVERAEVAKRPTQGIGKYQAGAAVHEKQIETQRVRRGRPKGAKNKVKPLMTNEFLLKIRKELTPQDYAYLENVVKNGQRIDILREIQIMFAVLGRNLLPMLLEEMQGDEEKYLRRDVTERLKVWSSLGNIVHQIEKNSDEGTDTREKPILEIFARRGADGDRIKILAGYESGGMGGISDGVGRAELDSGTIPDQFSERPISVQDSEQVETIRVFPDSVDRDDALGLHEEELQG